MFYFFLSVLLQITMSYMYIVPFSIVDSLGFVVVNVAGHDTSDPFHPFGGCCPDITIQCVERDVKHPISHLFGIIESMLVCRYCISIGAIPYVLKLCQF